MSSHIPRRRLTEHVNSSILQARSDVRGIIGTCKNNVIIVEFDFVTIVIYFDFICLNRIGGTEMAVKCSVRQNNY